MPTIQTYQPLYLDKRTFFTKKESSSSTFFTFTTHTQYIQRESWSLRYNEGSKILWSQSFFNEEGVKIFPIEVEKRQNSIIFRFERKCSGTATLVFLKSPDEEKEIY